MTWIHNIRLFLLVFPVLGFPQEQSDVQVLPAEVSPSGGQNNGWSGPPSGFTRPWPPTNSYAGPMGYSVPGWRQPQPRMWPSQPSYNTRPWRSFPQPELNFGSAMPAEENMDAVPRKMVRQAPMPWSELQQSSPDLMRAPQTPSCGQSYNPCGNGFNNGNSGFNPGFDNGNSGFNPGFDNGNSGFNPGFDNGNSGFNPGFGNGNSGFNPGCGMTVGGGCSDNSGFNPGAVVATAEPAPIIFDDESSSSGFNPGVETGNSGNGNWGFNPGYGNGGNQGYNPGFNSYTPLPGYGNCFNVCGNKPNRCGDRYGGGMFSGGCRPNRPVCRTRCSIKPTCGGNNWQYGNNGNSFGCGNGGGNMGYNPGYGYNPSINYPSQNGFVGMNTLPAASGGCGMVGGGCSDYSAPAPVVATAEPAPIQFDDNSDEPSEYDVDEPVRAKKSVEDALN